MDTEANAITISAYGASLVAVNSRRGSSIVHEAEHIKNHIWQYIGYTPQRDNDEVDAYLLTYIYDKITFGDNVDQKIIESAIIFWFKDVDCKSRNKVVSYFKEY